MAALDEQVQSRARAIVDQAIARREAPESVARALESIAAWARACLAAMGTEPAAIAYERRLDAIVASETGRFRAALGAPVVAAPPLASIFANAALKTPQPRSPGPGAVVVTCAHCGAPQESELARTCPYCGKPRS